VEALYSHPDRLDLTTPACRHSCFLEFEPIQSVRESARYLSDGARFKGARSDNRAYLNLASRVQRAGRRFTASLFR
jgi:hypothetical protein